jgi:hypothetical protein
MAMRRDFTHPRSVLVVDLSCSQAKGREMRMHFAFGSTLEFSRLERRKFEMGIGREMPWHFFQPTG